MKSISQGAMILVLILGILISLNYLGLNFPKRWDLTDEQEYTLAPATGKILDRLENRLTIKLYYSKNLPSMLLPVKERVSDILNEYKAKSKQSIHIEVVEPDLNEEIEKETLAMGILPLELNVVEKDKQQVVKAYMGMALYYQDKKQIIPVVTEVQSLEYLMDLNILKLTQKSIPKVGIFLSGNEENFKLIDQVVQQLGEPVHVTAETKDFEKLELSSMIVINPMDVTQDTANKLDELNQSGVPLLVFAGMINVDAGMQPSMLNTGLDDWFEEKGVLIDQRLLLDIKQNAQAGFQSGVMQVYMPYPFWVRAQQDDLNRNNIITSGLEDVLFPWTNVLHLSDDKKSNAAWEREILISSSKKSFLQEENELSVSPEFVNNMENLPEFKSYPLSIVLKPKKQGEADKTAPIFITATHHILQDMFLQRSQANAVFLANMVEMSTWGDHLIGIRSRGKTSRMIEDLPPSKRSKLKWTVTLGSPLAAVTIGLIGIFLIRKRRAAFVASLKLS